ncbi:MULTISPECIES: zinc-dependent alcohol dehydrogenase family protein [unclassified Mycobacteroides]|uniref:zinc-dependent alcohol dehydrogenase family protein n=1 Tax=unclassified Mycobacteroides TaxID=2618759 RepID=UPI0013F4C726|nr:MULTISPECIES: zinc-dependent alcohol dehydrogenase family protein [unclassified Mycobacteroides]
MTRPIRQLRLNTVGDPLQALSLVTVEDLAPGAGQVLVEVEAAPINPSDLYYASGNYLLRPEPPVGVGAEGSGRVTAVGSGVDHALIGRRVILLPTYRYGTWATHVVADVADVVVAPDDIDVLQLAMVGINAMTAHQLLRGYGNPAASNRWIGQTAGNSGVGEYVVKMSKRLGYKTLSIVRRQAAADQVYSWGGDRVVIQGDGLAEDLAAALGGARLDIAVDSVGGPASTALAHHLDYSGTLIAYGAQSGQPPVIKPFELIGNHSRLTGFWLKNWLDHTHPDEVSRAYGEVVGMVADGVIDAQIERTMGLDDWPEALSLAQEAGRIGKIVFTPKSGPHTPRTEHSSNK